MAGLYDDPRTRGMAGEKAARRQLAKVSDRLFAELGPDETASWVAMSAGMSPMLAVLTDRRLLAVPIFSAKPVRSASLPYTLGLTKNRILGWSVDVTGADGASFSLLLTQPDIDKLQPGAGPQRTPRVTSPPPVPVTAAPPTPPESAGQAPPPSSPSP